MNVYSEIEIFTLLENVFTLKFCRVVFEKFDLQKLERYKIERITVQLISIELLKKYFKMNHLGGYLMQKFDIPPVKIFASFW